MKRKLLWLLVGLLVGSGVAAATLVQAGGKDQGNQTVETESSEVEDADEPGDDDGPGDTEDADEQGEDDDAGEAEDD